MHGEGTEIKDVARRMAAIVDRFDERGAILVERHDASSARLGMVAAQAAGAIQSAAAAALGDIAAAARGAVEQGIDGPMRNLDAALMQSVDKMSNASLRLETRLEALRHVQTALAWKTLVACAVGSILAIGAAIYAGMQARRDVVQGDWVGEINAAVEKGRLTRCQGGGLCAVVGKRSYRLDR